MIIDKITMDYNQWMKRLNTQLNEPTNPNSFKDPKVILPTNKKTLGILKLGLV